MNPPDPKQDSSGGGGGGDQPLVVETIRRLQAGAVSGRALAAEDRRAVVEHLCFEGYSLVEIAQILKVSERTVIRDRKAIQANHAVERDPKLVAQLVGRLIHEAEACVSRIRRVVRDKECPHGVKVDAESKVWQILDSLTERLQSLGYLPTAAQRVEADLTHRLAPPEVPGVPALETELQELMALQQQVRPEDQAMLEQIQTTQLTLQRIGAAERVQEIRANLQPKEES